jgi:hypothetical protein
MLIAQAGCEAQLRFEFRWFAACDDRDVESAATD